MGTMKELLFELVWRSGSVRHKGWAVVIMEECSSDPLSNARRIVHHPTTAPSGAPQLSLQARSLPSLVSAND